MCNYGTTIECRVYLTDEQSCDGPGWKMKPVDACIAPLVNALNSAGILTASSCCGHGKQPGSILLQDGRELTILTPEVPHAD